NRLSDSQSSPRLRSASSLPVVGCHSSFALPCCFRRISGLSSRRFRAGGVASLRLSSKEKTAPASHPPLPSPATRIDSAKRSPGDETFASVQPAPSTSPGGKRSSRVSNPGRDLRDQGENRDGRCRLVSVRRSQDWSRQAARQKRERRRRR